VHPYTPDDVTRRIKIKSFSIPEPVLNPPYKPHLDHLTLDSELTHRTLSSVRSLGGPLFLDAISTGVLFSILALLILFSGFFSGSETALMSLNRYRVRHLAKNGHRGAIRTLKLLEQPDRLISLILLGNNFVNIVASAIATVIALRLAGEAGIAIATGMLTLVILVFAEVTPKTLAMQRAEQIAFFASKIYVPMLVICQPVIGAVNWTTGQLLKLLGTPVDHAGKDQLSSDEFRTVIDEAGSLIPDKHRDMLLNILDLEKVSVQEVMVPRNEIAAIDLADDWNDIMLQLSTSPYSRLLLFRENIDNVVGFIHLRDMVETLRSASPTRSRVESLVRDAYFIPESTPLTEQLLNFQKERRRIGLVVDEYGDIQGLLTLETILEEIVGEFTSDPEAKHTNEFQLNDDGSYVVPGTAAVRNLNRVLNWNLAHSGPKTLNGVVLEHFERFPTKGSVCKLNNHPVEILEVEDNRVISVRISPAVQPPQQDHAKTV